MPSGFTMKFRKYIRSKRLEDIKQIGVERVVVLTFGSGEMTNHIILELYSSVYFFYCFKNKIIN